MPTADTGQPQGSAAAPGDEARHRYDARLAGDIETRWQRWWAENDTFRAPNPGDPGFDASKPKFFCLDMFPYPSGAGIHVGHPEGYTATDIVSRYKRMRGFNVLHPMGWDAFGLPAEQYAVQTGVHPAETTRSAIENFRRQLQRFGFCYDWSREFATIDPGYYRWTQWIWLQLYNAWVDPRSGRTRPIAELEAALAAGDLPARVNPDAAEHAGATGLPEPAGWAGATAAERRTIIDSYRLAYLAEVAVNWCPKLGTVLANEEVIDGRSERGGYPVLRRPLRQWMFRITALAERLLEDLEPLDWPNSTKTQQREWIGRSEGAEAGFPLVDPPAGAPAELRIFTTRPDTMFGATYMVVAPEHPLVDAVLSSPAPGTPADDLRAYVERARNLSDVERQEAKEKTGVFSGLHAVNPANDERIPVWVADYVLMGYGTGAIMAVPGQDQRDWDFAKAFDLPILRTVQPEEGFDGEAFVGDGPAINSGFLDGLGVADAKARMIDWLEEQGRGERRVNYKLRDWLFSRQRYWGEPFPVVFDGAGDHHPVGEDHLPVTLPKLDDFKPAESEDPQPLLGKATDWRSPTAGEAGAAGLDAGAPTDRELNTMPNWAGSCWYYLRYCDPTNADRFVGRDAERYWMGENGVDLYIGGSEHAVLHLLYARFWHKALFDLGEVSTAEPFTKLFHQGLITSFAYRDAEGRLVPIDEVEEQGDAYVLKATGERVEQITAKMSKSLKNVVNPDDVIAEFGADTFRLYEMFMGPLEMSKPWSTRDAIGRHRFLQRLWRLAVDESTGELATIDAPDEAVEKTLHRTIAKVGDDIERLALNTAIAAMDELVNVATKAGGLTSDQLDRFARILSPFAPHIAEELWARLGNDPAVADAPWPAFDEAMLTDDEVEIPVQIKGKVRAKITVPADADQKALEKLALENERVAQLLEGQTVRKVIVVPGKLVNIVAG